MIPAKRSGLDWTGISRFGEDYADTLAEWAKRFEGAWSEIAQLGFDERFRKLWRFYLSYCEAGFRTGRTDVIQLGLSRVPGLRPGRLWQLRLQCRRRSQLELRSPLRRPNPRHRCESPLGELARILSVRFRTVEQGCAGDESLRRTSFGIPDPRIVARVKLSLP